MHGDTFSGTCQCPQTVDPHKAKTVTLKRKKSHFFHGTCFVINPIGQSGPWIIVRRTTRFRGLLVIFFLLVTLFGVRLFLLVFLL